VPTLLQGGGHLIHGDVVLWGAFFFQVRQDGDLHGTSRRAKVGIGQPPGCKRSAGIHRKILWTSPPVPSIL
jgi:hypothetical protein